MTYARLAALVGLAAFALAFAGTGLAATTGTADSGRTVHFNSEAAAKDSASGIPSFVLAPGQSVTFDYPTATGRDVISEIANQTPSVDSTIFGWTWRWAHYILGSHAWTWAHYTEWAGNGTCVTNALNNGQWSDYQGPLWRYRGAGGYYIWTINPCNTLWSGNQGHYEYCSLLCWEDDYPWELAEAFAWGNYRTYAFGCTGACG